eukprot:m.771800 g.771800  ORF g.771800 m.771800 type:complete len:73 (-) comp23245_c0_seq11:236-454(-)
MHALLAIRLLHTEGVKEVAIESVNVSAGTTCIRTTQQHVGTLRNRNGGTGLGMTEDAVNQPESLRLGQLEQR